MKPRGWCATPGSGSEDDFDFDHYVPSLWASAIEQMPTDACQIVYECRGCTAQLKPKPGDCCLFCSYGSIPCPPVQAARCQP